MARQLFCQLISFYTTIMISFLTTINHVHGRGFAAVINYLVTLVNGDLFVSLALDFSSFSTLLVISGLPCHIILKHAFLVLLLIVNVRYLTNYQGD